MEKTDLNSSEKLNLKEEYKRSAGKKVPHDFFIFSCMAEDHTLQTLGQNAHVDDRWPALAERRETGNLDDPMPEKSFDESVQDLMQWYAKTYPELTSQQVLDHELCSLLVPRFILMVNDIRQLVFIKNNKGLPQIPSDEPRPEIWDTLEKLLTDSFPTYASYLMSYFKWVYAKPVERKLTLSDLPPVGRYFGILKDNLRNKDKSENESESPRINSRELPLRKPEREKEVEESSSASEEEPSSDDEESFEAVEEAPPAPVERKERERSERSEYREPRHKGGRDRGERDEDKGKKDKEKLALLEVDKAILAMKKHSSMNEFRLRPQNSFIRRLQHRKVNALGFQSHSVGEDDNRAVLITRED